jgi:Lrp/AsnC family leucine-responsive transcriptional regulator
VNSLDLYDKDILRTLQEQGKISNQDLAEKVNLSPSACLRRVKTLEDNGYITNYRCIVDMKKLGLGLLVIVSISMDKHTPERFEVFEASISKIPEVTECLLITGQSADYQLKLCVRDLEHYHQILLGKITKITGVTGVHSSFVLNQVIQNRVIPIY